MDRFTDLQIYIIKVLDELIDIGTKENSSICGMALKRAFRVKKKHFSAENYNIIYISL